MKRTAHVDLLAGMLEPGMVVKMPTAEIVEPCLVTLVLYSQPWDLTGLVYLKASPRCDVVCSIEPETCPHYGEGGGGVAWLAPGRLVRVLGSKPR